MKKLGSLLLILGISIISLNLKAQGYEIKIKIANLKSQKLILGHHFVDQLIPDDTITLNNKGEGAFKGKTSLPGGMYFIFLPSRNYFDIFISDNQNFTIENDTTDFLKNMKITGNKENNVFIEYQAFLAQNREKVNALTEEYKATKDENRKKEIEKEYNEINKLVGNKAEETIKANPDLFFSQFLKATQEVKIPESITDQNQKYYYYRNNYFKYFDYKDKRLLRTPIYESRLDYYLDKVVPQNPDSIIPEVDILIENSRYDKELFRYMLVHLFNKYAKSQLMGMENVYLHIGEKYYITEAEWSDKKFIDELKENIRRKKPALIGNLSPEIKMILLPNNTDAIDDVKQALTEMKEQGNAIIKDEVKLKEEAKLHKSRNPQLTDSAAYSQVLIGKLADKLENMLIPKFEGYISLLDQKAKYLILYFWEPDCSHCKEATPKFSEAYDQKNLKDLGVQVMAVYLHRNINEWEKYTKSINEWLEFILKNKMLKWTNVWEPFGYSQFRDKYDISSSPVLYLLDKDKKIIAKRISWEQAVDLIHEIEKSEQK
jgi:thiol-disulfide isomerase/thioredoxin